MAQSRIDSFLESVVNTLIGFLVALSSQLVIFPLYGIHNSLSTDISITCWFTLVSVLRSYLLRRYFNTRLTRVIRGSNN
jgi:hypothetical protein